MKEELVELGVIQPKAQLAEEIFGTDLCNTTVREACIKVREAVEKGVIESWFNEKGYLELNYPIFIDCEIKALNSCEIKEIRLTPDGIFLKTKN